MVLNMQPLIGKLRGATDLLGWQLCRVTAAAGETAAEEAAYRWYC